MDEDLYQLFCEFAAFGAGKGAVAELDNAKFAKFARDCGVLDKAVTSTQVDLTFAKVKEKSARKINFDQFRTAIAHLAAMKYPGDDAAYDTLVSKILTSHGPAVASNVKVDTTGIYSKLTDTSLYTGAHKERFDSSGGGLGLAGRDSVAVGAGTHTAHHGGAVSDLSQVTREGMRGGTSLTSAARAKDSAPAIERIPARVTSRDPSPKRSPAPEAHVASSRPSPDAAHAVVGATDGDLFSVFVAYCSFGGSVQMEEMDNAKFAKLCREAGVQDKRVTPASVDITFSKYKEKGKRHINFGQFMQCMASLAKEKYPGEEPEAAKQRIIDVIVSAGGPALVGASKADASGIYSKLTDTSLYTGAHKERFNDDGTGRGLAGRDSVSVGAGSVM